MKLRKILSVLSAILLLATYVPLGAVSVSAVGEPTIVLEPSVTFAGAGDTFEVAVSLMNNPGVIGAAVEIEFDTDVFELVIEDYYDEDWDEYITRNKIEMAPGWRAPYVTYAPLGTCHVRYANGTANKNVLKELFYTATFKVKDDAEPGTYPLTVKYDPRDFWNVDMERVTFSAQNTAITIDGQLSCDHEYFFPCDTFCMICGETTNPDAAHSVIYMPAVEGTCITIGHVEYWYCEYCGACWGIDGMLPPSPPTYGDHKFDEVVTEPTCTVPGYITYTCIYCGATYTEPLPATGHSYDNACDAECNLCGAVRVITGITGDCTWTLDGTHLTISGNGAMGDYTPSNKAPWGTAITSVTIEEGVISIGSNAFYECTSLQSVTIPNSVTSIGNWAFYWCRSLESVTIPDSVTKIGGWAFRNCSSLMSVTIPDSVTEIGYSVFYGCSSLMSVTIPDSVTSIGSYAFTGCTSLTSVTIPDSVTSIGESTFHGCTSLQSVTIPDSVTSIVDWAFYGCSKLTDVYYEGNETDRDAITIGSYNTPLLNATWHYAICDHEYDDDCDVECNLCGATRVAPHSYVDDCDRDCDVCGATRVAPHIYSSDCDNSCNLCGAKRKPIIDHVYTDNCDRDCNVCKEFREPPHDYADKYDDTCDICGVWREIVIIYGDVTGNDVIDILDEALLSQYVNGWDVLMDEVTADVNSDGVIDILDEALLSQYVNGWNVTLG